VKFSSLLFLTFLAGNSAAVYHLQKGISLAHANKNNPADHRGIGAARVPQSTLPPPQQ
jgi:hypothetical protein